MPASQHQWRALHAVIAQGGAREDGGKDPQIHYVESRDERRAEPCDVQRDEGAPPLR